MNDLLSFLDELAEKYNFSDEDVDKLEDILYEIDDELYGDEYKDDENYDVTEEEYGKEEE